MKMVFLSYAPEDIDFARQLYNKLSKKGLNIWFAEKKVKWGANLIDETQKALYASAVVITIVTPASKASQWTAFEMGAARTMGKKIIPILMSKNINIMPFHLSQMQFILAKGKTIDEISLKIIDEIKEDIKEEPVQHIYSELTKRETQVLRLIGQGLTSSEIADKLEISKRGVDSLRSQIMSKMHLTTLPQLIRVAVRMSLKDL